MFRILKQPSGLPCCNRVWLFESGRSSHRQSQKYFPIHDSRRQTIPRLSFSSLIRSSNLRDDRGSSPAEGSSKTRFQDPAPWPEPTRLFFIPSAQLRRIKFLVTGKPYQPELISRNISFRVRQLGVGFEGRDTFSSKFIELQRPPLKKNSSSEESLPFLRTWAQRLPELKLRSAG